MGRAPRGVPPDRTGRRAFSEGLFLFHDVGLEAGDGQHFVLLPLRDLEAVKWVESKRFLGEWVDWCSRCV